MSILQSLVNQNAFWSMLSQRLPPNIRDYKCQFVSEQYQKPTKQIIYKDYLKFTNNQAQSFEIVVNQVSKPVSSLYQAEINVQDAENPQVNVKHRFDSICFTSVKGYQRPAQSFKEIEIDEDCQMDDPGDMFQFLDIGINQNQSDSDSDNSYLADFAPQNQKFVRHEILIFIKDEANRFKKLKDIKAHLRQVKYNVPDNHLKKILTDFCGTHIFDKKRGFLVHEEYLSMEQKVKRRLEDEQADKKNKQKDDKKGQKKKATKKETKNDQNSKKKMVIPNEEVVHYAEQKNSESMRKIINQIKPKK